MSNAKKIEQQQAWRDKILQGVANNICQPCTEPTKENASLNYDNPLNCGCRCDDVDYILSMVVAMDADIKKLKN